MSVREGGNSPFLGIPLCFDRAGYTINLTRLGLILHNKLHDTNAKTQILKCLTLNFDVFFFHILTKLFGF